MLITKFPLKGAPKVKEVLAKNVPYACEAPKINFDRVFHTKAKTRSKLILEASIGQDPFHLEDPFQRKCCFIYFYAGNSICFHK